MRVLIPCAGLGTRMGMNPNQSKEMLIDPITSKPMIDWIIDACKWLELDYLVITRREKQDLIDHIDNEDNLQIINPNGEWPNTLLQSIPNWYEENVVVLPDTRFCSPKYELVEAEKLLEHYDTIWGIHNVNDRQNWGIVENNTICEKPSLPGIGKAWGMFGFKYYYGKTLLNQMSQKGVVHDLPISTAYFFMDNFVDLTRTGKVLEYNV